MNNHHHWYNDDDEFHHHRQQPNNDDDALAKALAASEYEFLQQQEQQEQQRRLQEKRIAETEDQELAQAMEFSQHQADLQHQEQQEQQRRLQEKRIAETEDQELAQAMEFSQHQADKLEASEHLEQIALKHKRSRTEDRNEGSWDCTNCTFTNLPYRQKCAMCFQNAPPNVLSFKSMPSKLRFGLEIEIIVPDGRRDGHSFESIAQALTRLGTRVEYATGDDARRTSDHWKLVKDLSVKGREERDLCFELVSPILQGEGPTGLGSFRDIMDSVRRLGVTTNSSCGFHVHVDATTSRDPKQAAPEMGSLAGLQRVAQCFVALENAFDLLVALTWDDNHTSNNSSALRRDNNRRTNLSRYCNSNRVLFGERSNRQRWDMISNTSNILELVQLINPQHDRRRKLNLTNLVNPNKPSTCEFRHHGGVEEIKEAEAWVRLILQFCEKCSQLCPNSSACLLYETATPNEELKALFALVNCEGLEQFFTVERKLYDEGRLSNEWACRICHRKFQNSRSLSQHMEATRHFPPNGCTGANKSSSLGSYKPNYNMK